MFPRSLCLALTLSTVACQETPDASTARTARRDRPTFSITDSLRARRQLRASSRPDTTGIRVDSLRVLGRADAPVWVVVVSDFECAECRYFALRGMSELRKAAANGEIRLGFVNAPQPNNFNARFAAHAAMCAASTGRFWAMHDSLFAAQPSWSRMDDPREYFDDLAATVGVDRGVQGACTKAQRLAPLISGDLERARRAGAVTVPSVFVNNRLLSSEELSASGLRAAISRARG